MPSAGCCLGRTPPTTAAQSPLSTCPASASRGTSGHLCGHLRPRTGLGRVPAPAAPASHLSAHRRVGRGWPVVWTQRGDPSQAVLWKLFLPTQPTVPSDKRGALAGPPRKPATPARSEGPGPHRPEVAGWEGQILVLRGQFPRKHQPQVPGQDTSRGVRTPGPVTCTLRDAFTGSQSGHQFLRSLSGGLGLWAGQDMSTAPFQARPSTGWERMRSPASQALIFSRDQSEPE